jgi:hypothetical protein
MSTLIIHFVADKEDPQDPVSSSWVEVQSVFLDDMKCEDALQLNRAALEVIRAAISALPEVED